jgi:hypothetical protein
LFDSPQVSHLEANALQVGIGNDFHPAATPFAIDGEIDEGTDFVDGEAELTRSLNKNETLQVDCIIPPVPG